ncbi:MAG: DUF885 domain-containing protein [Lachnospiraceae bacterium]|nr:DUF885 domain-containing protein [Lachnospiraceae bacterium]
MRKFKKFTSLALVVALSFSLYGCDKEKDLTTTESTSIVSTVDNTTEDNSTESTAEAIDEEAAKAEQQKFDDWCMEEFRENVNSDSITLNYSVANPEAYGIVPVKATYGDADTSLEAEEKNAAENQATLDEMEKFNFDLLTPEQQYTYKVYHEKIALDIEGVKYHYFFEPFAYTSGLQTNMPITLAEYTFYDKQDIEDYIELIKQFPEYIDNYLDFEKEKSEQGMFMSLTSANEVIRQCKEFIAKPDENLLIATFDSRVEEFEGLTPEEVDAYKKANKEAVLNNLIPAYNKIISTFELLKTTGKNDGGLSNLENGKEYYTYMLKYKTGSDKTPEELIDLLDSKTKELINEVSSIYLSNMDDMTAYYEAAESEEGIYEKFTDYKATINRIHDKFKDRFPEMPTIDFKTQAVHKSLEKITSPAFYMTPALDNYTSNSIYVNESSVDNNGLWSTLSHEGVPGHMYQFTYYLSTNPSPLRTLLSFTGYQEGWATYAENMSFDMYDKFKAPCYADMERINNELNLIVSARAEIGVNYQGWSEDDLRDYLTKTGLNPEATKNLFDYVVKEPINYQMYVLGFLEIKGLREYAEEELEDDFNEVLFHKVILDAGPSQFYYLRELVDQYIDDNI